MELQLQETTATALVDAALKQVSAVAQEKGLKLVKHVAPDLPRFVADEAKLLRTLVNLLGNAVKYTPANGRVVFRVNITDKNIEVSVQDTGLGIAADELEKVFEKFYRSTDPRVQEQTGTGLGLALSQEVVRLHGGKITVESELNKGSTFNMTLPLG